MDRLRVGVIGCGAISKIYLQNLTGQFADRVEVLACADVMLKNAEERASQYKVPRACSPAELLADPKIELVLNLTPAPAHHEVILQILRAGKHVYTEKPLALSMDAGREILREADNRRLRVACAPDTLLGAGLQTCRKLIDDGKIGKPVAAQGFVSLSSRSDRYLSVFRGPLLDLGPYHVGALLMLLGSVRAVSGAAQPLVQRKGETFNPESIGIDNPANSAAVLEFENGCLGTINATVESLGYMPTLKVYGTTGVITVPDPNAFGGPVSLQSVQGKPAEDVPLTHKLAENGRGVGVWDMAQAIREDRPHRLGADLALHELDVMLGVIDSAKQGRRVQLTTRTEPGEAMPAA